MQILEETEMDYSEKWGVDVEEAVKLALIDLKLSRDEVEVTVLEEPSKGFFGIGSKLAKVRVEKKKPAVEEKPAEPVKKEKLEQKKSEKAENPVSGSRRRKREQKKNLAIKETEIKKEIITEIERRKKNLLHRILISNPVNKDDLHDIDNHEALAFLKEITEKMGLALNFHAKAGEDIVYLEMDGKDSGTIIGKRGQTLDAIQYLTSLVVNKDSEKYIKVVIDAENYQSETAEDAGTAG